MFLAQSLVSKRFQSLGKSGIGVSDMLVHNFDTTNSVNAAIEHESFPVIKVDVSHKVLDSDICRSLEDELMSRLADEQTQAVVLEIHGVSVTWQCPAYVSRSEEALGALRSLIACVRSSEKPICAVMTGVIVDGALELALAAHGRVAHKDVLLALRNSDLFLVPDAGASQYGARIAGAAPVLSLLLNTGFMPVSDVRIAALFDRVTSERPLPIALDQALNLQGFLVPSGWHLGVAQSLWETEQAREKYGHDELTRTLIDCVEAAFLLPELQGLECEYDARERLAGEDNHALSAYHRTARDKITAPGRMFFADTKAVQTIGVYPGSGLELDVVERALHADLKIVLFGHDIARLTAHKTQIISHLQGLETSLDKNSELIEKAKERILLHAGFSGLSELDIAFELGAGVGVAPRVRMRELGRKMPQNALLISSVSNEKIYALALKTGRASRVFGMRAPLTQRDGVLVELVCHADIDDSARAAMTGTLAVLGYFPIFSTPAPHRFADLILEAACYVADALILQGVEPVRIDAALRDAGWTSALLENRHTGGLAIASERRRRYLSQYAQDVAKYDVAGALLNNQVEDEAASKGYYGFDAERLRHDQSITGLLRTDGFNLRGDVGSDTIVGLISAAILHEAVVQIAGGTYQSVSDIDLLLSHPSVGAFADMGGPMRYAEQRGLARVHMGIGELQKTISPHFVPHHLFLECVKTGKSLDVLGTTAKVTSSTQHDAENDA